jgi:hypothetical protein
MSAMATFAVTRAQTPAGPDIVGFRPGLGIQAAYGLLKTYDPKVDVTAAQITVPEISDTPLPYALVLRRSDASAIEEEIQLDLTLPPNPQVVYKVTRRLRYERGREIARANLLPSLRMKYGDFRALSDRMTLMWLFDEQGSLLPQSSQVYTLGCGFVDVVPNIPAAQVKPLHEPEQEPLLLKVTPPHQRPCLSLTYVQASVGGPPLDQELVSEFRMAVTDLALMLRAQQATAELIAAARQKAREQELERGRQRTVPNL